jgi:hypothetical protein
MIVPTIREHTRAGARYSETLHFVRFCQQDEANSRKELVHVFVELDPAGRHRYVTG